MRHIGGWILFLVLGVMLLPCSSHASAFEPAQVLHRNALEISIDGNIAHTDTSRVPSAVVQEWGLGARFSILPFPIVGSSFYRGTLAIGLGPYFQRFNTLHQNQAGVGLWLRYYLVGLRWGRVIPWIDASATPSGGDLRIQDLGGNNFMFIIQGGIGVSYFVSNHWAIYGGYRFVHDSNAYTYGPDRGIELNGAAMGVSYFLK